MRGCFRVRVINNRVGLLIVSYAALCVVTAAHSVPPATGATISFTQQQATSGAKVYATSCAACHGSNLEGAAAPTLSGAAFVQRWEGGQRTVADLLRRIDSSMPLGAPHSLSTDDYIGVTAFILARNQHAPGTTPLSEANAAVPLTAPEGVAASVKSPVSRPTLPQAPESVAAASGAKPDDDELAHPADQDWLMYNRDFSGGRFSPLQQITARNANRLVAVCMFQAGEVGNFQSAPVVYDGLLYFTTPYNTFALDPRTCRKRWEHRYPEDKAVTLALSRGVALYRGKVFRVTPNGHLLALDAKTGTLLWDVWLADKDRGYWLSAAPVTHQGRVFMGTAGADWGTSGNLYALDAENGRIVWTFHTIPTGDEPGADTWPKDGARGGGSFWSTFALDRQTNQLFASLGNPSPDYDGTLRPGDNLFTNAVVALEASSGKLAWWVQQRPHDTHDWDTAAAPILYEIDGQKRMAVASKDGWLYVYDRERHALIRKLEISPHKNADVPLSTQEVYHCPGISGGAVWNGPAYSPRERVLLVNSVHWCGKTRLTQERYVEGSSYFGGEHTWDPPENARGFTRAFDASSGRELWSREFETPILAGLTPTAGGVTFTGTLDGDFLALDTRTGKNLYSFNTGGAVAGAASTYLADGRQYIAIASGNTSRVHWMTGGSMTLVVFALAQ